MMPAREEIVAGLIRIANLGFWGAVLWHVALAAVVAALATGWRPARRTAELLFLAPLASVSVFAFGCENPFNGGVFALLAAALAVLALRMPEARTERGPGWAEGAGVALLVFAWVYPHFLVDRPQAAYLVASPMELLPCPTLAALCGLALVAGGFSHRWFSLLLALAAALYAIVGVVFLRVYLDVVLALAAVALAVVALGVPKKVGGATSEPRELLVHTIITAGDGARVAIHVVSALRGARWPITTC